MSTTEAARARDGEVQEEHLDPPSGWRALFRQLVMLPIRAYRLTGPFRQPRCRFHPTCSTYAMEAVRVHGAFKGVWLATRRLLRCHPWNPGGVDHVPPRSSR